MAAKLVVHFFGLAAIATALVSCESEQQRAMREAAEARRLADETMRECENLRAVGEYIRALRKAQGQEPLPAGEANPEELCRLAAQMQKYADDREKSAR